MSPGETPAQAPRADLRAWLEEAIVSADAVLTPTVPSPATSETETVVASPTGLRNHNRNLVTVRRITAVRAIKKKHRLVAIDGWNVVVEKDKGFTEGEYVLFAEIDAFLPAHSAFEKLFAEAGSLISFDGEEGYRVGSSVWTDRDGSEIISQGHVFHLSDFPEINQKVCDLHWDHIDQTEEEFADFLRELDFSDELGVKKWESFTEPKTSKDDAAPSNPKPPSFILKADMERVQNCPNLFIKPKYQRFIFQESLKMDGATTTIYFIPNDSPLTSDIPTLPKPDYTTKDTYIKFAIHPTGRLGVCTRHQDLLPHLLPSKSAPTHNLSWRAALDANLAKILPKLNQPIAIQAELVGASIQGNPYNYPQGKHELFVFSILDLTSATGNGGNGNGTRRWHPRKVEDFAAEHGLKHVPVLGYHTIPSVARHHQDLVDRAELKKGEGLVFKNCTDGRWFKVLSNRWILEKGDEMLARKARVAVGKVGEEKGKGGDVEEKKESVSGWEVSKAEMERIREIFEDLEEWIRRDDGLKKWMEEWERGFHRGEETNGVGEAEKGPGKGQLVGKTVSVGTSAKQNGQGANGFGVPEAKRKELEDWLGIKGSAF